MTKTATALAYPVQSRDACAAWSDLSRNITISRFHLPYKDRLMGLTNDELASILWCRHSQRGRAARGRRQWLSQRYLSVLQVREPRGISFDGYNRGVL